MQTLPLLHRTCKFLFAVLKDEIRRVEAQSSTVELFVALFLREADRVDAFFVPELDDTLSHTELLVQRAADYSASDIACLSGLRSLSEALTSLTRK
jgi:hypothetical protein